MGMSSSCHLYIIWECPSKKRVRVNLCRGQIVKLFIFSGQRHRAKVVVWRGRKGKAVWSPCPWYWCMEWRSLRVCRLGDGAESKRTGEGDEEPSAWLGDAWGSSWPAAGNNSQPRRGVDRQRRTHKVLIATQNIRYNLKGRFVFVTIVNFASLVPVYYFCVLIKCSLSY